MDENGPDQVAEIEIECPTLARLEASVYRRRATSPVWRAFVVAHSVAPRRRRQTTLPLPIALAR